MIISDIVNDIFQEALDIDGNVRADGSLRDYLITAYVVKRFAELVPSQQRTIEMMDEMYQWLDYHYDAHKQK